MMEIDRENIPVGDMPGDKILIDDHHIEMAGKILSRLQEDPGLLSRDKIVISVHGGSGVGKSETASVLAYLLNDLGHRTYILSGDNYPLRVPANNDIERLGVYRRAALRELALSIPIDAVIESEIRRLWESMEDIGDPSDSGPSWLNTYREAGKKALDAYLASEQEIDFAYLNSVVSGFKSGDGTLNLKRMGREEAHTYYQKVDFTETQVLLIEWTHGNNSLLEGVDYPIYLYSSPEETLEHRRKRARDKNTDSPLIQLVLQLEHGKLVSQAPGARLILSKNREFLDISDLRK